MSRLVSTLSLMSAILMANIIASLKHLAGCLRKLNPIYNSPAIKVTHMRRRWTWDKGDSNVWTLIQSIIWQTLNAVHSEKHKLIVSFHSLEYFLKILRKIPGPRSLPIIGAQWMYWRIVGKYRYEKYHEANEEKLKNFGSVVREDVIWNFPLIHIFDSKVIQLQKLMVRTNPVI